MLKASPYGSAASIGLSAVWGKFWPIDIANWADRGTDVLALENGKGMEDVAADTGVTG